MSDPDERMLARPKFKLMRWWKPALIFWFFGLGMIDLARGDLLAGVVGICVAVMIKEFLP